MANVGEKEISKFVRISSTKGSMLLEIHIDASPRVVLASHPRYRQKSTDYILDSTTETVTNLYEYLIITVPYSSVHSEGRISEGQPSLPAPRMWPLKRLRLRDKKIYIIRAMKIMSLSV